jgi:hypothetical protein
MTVSRLALATVVTLRAVLVYGEAAGAQDATTWRELLPARLRMPQLAPAAPRAELIREAPS